MAFFLKILALELHNAFKLLRKNLKLREENSMKRILKLVSAVLAIVGVILMLATQVTVEWYSGAKEAIGIQALIGGTFKGDAKGVAFDGVSSGLAGYILLGVGALIIAITALVAIFREHDILSMVVTGIGVICIIIGVILIFLIRKNFADIVICKTVWVGWGAITAGSLGSLAGGLGIIGMLLDLTGNN